MFTYKLDHIGLNVKSLEESISFYQKLFDFKLIEKWDNSKQAFIGKNNETLGLIENPKFDFKAYTVAHIAFSVDKDQFQNIISFIQDNKVDIVDGPKPQRGGETILFRDPSGNSLEVCYPSMAVWRKQRT